MAAWIPDQTFYPSPKMAMEAPAEEIAYVAIVNPKDDGQPDQLRVIDVKPDSPAYGTLVGRMPFGYPGDELHHFGRNACSAALCPNMPHPHMERRYLLVPGLRSSRIYVVDTKPDPCNPKIVQTIEPEEVFRKAKYSRPHTVHCGPDAIYINALGAPDGDGPGGVFLMDHQNFEVKGQWEKDRGDQYLTYDFWWHLGYDTMISSEWGTTHNVENGVVPDILLNSKYGHQLHVWDLAKRRHIKTLGMGSENQMVLELRPAHDPQKAYGFVGVVTSLKDLSASVWLWYRENNDWAMKKVIEVPAEPVDAEVLPPILKGFGAVAPLITDITLSLDDRFLYVSCWGTDEFIQYDVSDPFNPKKTGSVHLGELSVTPPMPRGGGSIAAHKWSRSAATAGESMLPTPFTCRGTPSSTQRASKDGR